MITLINHQGLKLIKGIQIQTPAPPLGLAYIGAYLKNNGFSYTAIDACGEALDQIISYKKNEQVMIQGLSIPEVIDRIPGDPKIIGFSCSYSHCWSLVAEIAARAKEKFPLSVFIAGGEHPSAMPEYVLNSGVIDVVIQGEGEETVLEFTKRIDVNQPWHDLDGISYLNKQGECISNNPRQRIMDLNSIPYPDWDSWNIEKYINHQQVSGINLGRSMPILGSRGCPYGCTFCSNEHMWTRRYVMRDGKSIVDEMEFMKKKYHLSGFSFFDSTFIINRTKTLDFCRELIERKLDISYQLPAGTRCETFDDELAFALERSGLINFSFAPESGSEFIRNIVKKQIKMDTFLKAIKVVKKTKMTVGCFIVLGFPEDNKETMKQSLSLVRKLALMGLDDITVSKFTPYPGSIYFNDLKKKGYFSNNFEELNNIISFYSEGRQSYCKSLTAKQLHRWMTWMFVNFYVISFILRPWRLISNLWNYFSKGIEKTRYMRFFSEMCFNRKKWKKPLSKEI